jgi:ABC-type polysaccharide/polyol phosphate export permease
MLFSLLGAAAFTSIALLCASKTKSIPAVSGMTNLITIPMVMMCGVFFSKNNFPESFQTFLNYMPLTALVDALRKIALEAATLSELSFEASVLVAYTVVFAVLAKKRFV